MIELVSDWSCECGESSLITSRFLLSCSLLGFFLAGLSYLVFFFEEHSLFRAKSTWRSIHMCSGPCQAGKWHWWQWFEPTYHRLIIIEEHCLLRQSTWLSIRMCTCLSTGYHFLATNRHKHDHTEWLRHNQSEFQVCTHRNYVIDFSPTNAGSVIFARQIVNTAKWYYHSCVHNYTQQHAWSNDRSARDIDIDISQCSPVPVPVWLQDLWFGAKLHLLTLHAHALVRGKRNQPVALYCNVYCNHMSRPALMTYSSHKPKIVKLCLWNKSEEDEVSQTSAKG